MSFTIKKILNRTWLPST